MSTKPIYATSLETAKEGEIVMYSYGWNTDVPAKIERTTPTVIVVKNQKFNRRGHLKGGDAWNRTYIHVTSPEEVKTALDEREREKLANTIPEIKYWRKLSLDQLRQVHALIQSFNA